MAKQGLSYYQAETDRFQDIKIKRLKKKYGCEGYAVYTYIVVICFQISIFEPLETTEYTLLSNFQ